MALQDFNPNKLRSFRYNVNAERDQPQTFNDRHSGTIVTGNRKPLEELYLESIEKSKPGATPFDPGPDTPLNDNGVQTYTVTNRAGEYEITGLRGEIVSGDDDRLYGSSLILTNYKSLIEASTFTDKLNASRQNSTLGFTQIPRLFKSFGFGSVNQKGQKFNFNPGVGFTTETQRGESARSEIIDEDFKLITEAPFYGDFLDRQTQIQLQAPMRGAASFDIFNTIRFEQNLNPNSKVPRIGDIVLGTPRYSEHTPLWGVSGNEYFQDNETIDIGGSEFQKGMGKPDLNFTPKMWYLYKNFMIDIQKDPGSGFNVDSFMSAANDYATLGPLPIIPAKNEIKSNQNNTNISSLDDSSVDKLKSYMTLGQRQLTNVSRYEDTLMSPSELNSFIDRQGAANEIDSKTGVKPSVSGQDLSNLLDEASTKQGGGERADKVAGGGRFEGRRKVYSIGRTGAISNVTYDEKGENPIKKNGEKFVYDGVDKVNMIPYGKRDEGENDFVPLQFYDVYNKRYITFRAILGAITDTITPEWTEDSFVGRPLKSAVYTGVGRSIGFSFKIYPKSRQEFPVLLEKLNYLTGLCYPHFDTYARQVGPIIRLTLADIVGGGADGTGQLGYITSLTNTFPEESSWETQKGLRFTKQIDVDVEFAYIGNNIPIASGKHYGLDFIANTGGEDFRSLQGEDGINNSRLFTENSQVEEQVFGELLDVQ